ncbi:MAG: PEP-CTERM sorting domain-containing protein [Planctomycetota bacterium]|nr:PEP-CTERM sorting domain-containing protein [Planctomycetota bacterium]
MRTVASTVVVLAAAGLAQAGSVSGSGSASFFGSVLPITTWNIATDAAATSTEFGAEGMAFLNGTLYVTHDHDSVRSAGNLVQYTPGAGGNLGAFTRTQFGSGPAGLWGPEGITFNTSGSGYGSYGAGTSVKLVGVETRGTNSFGVFDTGAPGSNPADIVLPAPEIDDITWVPSLGLFAAPEEGAGDASNLRFFDGVTMATLPGMTALIDGTKGITTVSAAFASQLTGLPVTTSEALIVVSELKALAVFDTTGVQIGGTVDLSSYLTGVSELESVAVDELNNLLYLGDEAGRSIHVVTVPVPGAVALAGIALAGVARRRRA